MFKRRRAPYSDLSSQLRDVRLWSPFLEVTRIEPVNSVCALCVDTHSRLFAVGTSHGEIRIYDEVFRETILVTPKAVAVKMLQFARPGDLFKLLCIDNKNVLHVWNLDAYGIPPLQVSQQLDGLVHRVVVCLRHSHALLATQSGEIVTFDLSSLRLSPYRIPYALDVRDHSNIPGPAIDVAILPSKLQHVLIGYEDETILYDLVSKKVLKTYVLAPMSTMDIPSYLTTLAIHPLEQHFAAGYVDGTICIWDLPSSKCLWVGTAEGALKSYDADNMKREPVFKLEWTYMEGKEDSYSCWLTVLGGQRLSGSSQNCISALGINTGALRTPNVDAPSGLILGRFPYRVPYPAQDFAIIPPNIASATTHGQIVLLSGGVGHSTALDSFEFPPTLRQSSSDRKLEGDRVVAVEFSAELEESEERSRGLAATLDDLEGSSEEDAADRAILDVAPASVPVPFQLLTGVMSVLDADMIIVDKPEYSRLARRPEGSLDSKDHYRILVTRHLDKSVRFYDVSTLSDGGVNMSLHPHAMEHLTIRVLDIPEIALRPDTHKISITGVAVASESLECAVSLSTGEVVVLGLGLQLRTIDVMDDELIDLSDVRDNGDTYTPRFIVRARNGGVAEVCLSDIGFLAIAFRHGLLLIIDMRGPNIILRDAQDATTKAGEASIAKCLCWTVSALGDDNTLAPRLLALRQDGILIVYTLIRSNGAWTVDKGSTTRDVHHSLRVPIMSLVLDIQDGSNRAANAASFAHSMESPTGISTVEETAKPHSLWIAASQREIRCGLNINGDKVSKVNFSLHDALEYTSLVNAYGSSVLLTFSHDQGIVYSLPSLEAIYSFKLPVSTQTSLSIRCTQSGDLLQTYRSSEAGVVLVFTSLFAHSRSLPSGNVNFRIHKYADRTLAASDTKGSDVQATSSWGWGSGVASWIKSFTEEPSITGDELDLLLAGPEVPAVSVKPSAATTPSHTSTDRKKKPVGGASNWGQDMYQQLTSAASERGERLGELEDHFRTLEAGSKDMVAQAKKLAEKQAARRWFL